MDLAMDLAIIMFVLTVGPPVFIVAFISVVVVIARQPGGLLDRSTSTTKGHSSTSSAGYSSTSSAGYSSTFGSGDGGSGAGNCGGMGSSGGGAGGGGC